MSWAREGDSHRLAEPLPLSASGPLPSHDTFSSVSPTEEPHCARAGTICGRWEHLTHAPRLSGAVAVLLCAISTTQTCQMAIIPYELLSRSEREAVDKNGRGDVDLVLHLGKAQPLLPMECANMFPLLDHAEPRRFVHMKTCGGDCCTTRIFWMICLRWRPPDSSC